MVCTGRKEGTEGGGRAAGKAGKMASLRQNRSSARRDDRSHQVAEVTLFGFSILPCGKLIAFRTADN